MEQVCIAKVALESATYAIDKPYDYLVPPQLDARAQVGVRVLVPFGAGNRRSEGLILARTTGTQVAKIKEIAVILDEAPVLDAKSIQLALYMRERYFCTVYAAARVMLPAGLWFSVQDSYSIAQSLEKPATYAAAGRSEHAKAILDLLWDNGCTLEVGKIRTAFGQKDPNPALRQLVEAQIIALETTAARGVGDKTDLLVSLAVNAEEALAQAASRRKTAPLRYAVIELLCGIGSASSKEICYYTGAAMATLRSLAKSGLVTLEKRAVLRRVALEPVEPQGEPVLTPEQQTAFDGLDALLHADKPAAALLYGVTGSGKTQVYIRLILSALAAGKTAMVLVPEIVLTPQLLRIFSAHFGDTVAVLHSALRAGERYDEWKRIRSGQAKVVLGTRSAVFAPLVNLGLIILDEEQESSYKSENNPRYHACDVAKYRCAHSGGLLVLGSATPSVETMYLAKTGVYSMFYLTRRYNAQAMPSVLVADMKLELRSGNQSSISALLHRELAANLARGEQSILFLNRRGASRMVLCESCGDVPSCPRCSVYLTYHSANRRLMCHQCGHSIPLPDYCPSCDAHLTFVGTGTQRVQEELQQFFPEVDILRMDTDTITATRTHEVILSEFQKKKVPILLGTQMVAKGLDFENVTLVGVIAADLGLYVDSFRASERTFSLLTQVVGRAGRGEKSGRAVIQTYTPDHEVIRYAAAQDYDSFYEQEIALRRLLDVPPFQEIIVITAAGTDETAVLCTCQRLQRSLAIWLKKPSYDALGVRLLGPAPASIAKVNNRYRYRLTLFCKNGKLLRALVSHQLGAAAGDKLNKGVSLFADVNPYE